MIGEEKAADSPWQWYPNEGVGPVRFGDSVHRHVFSLRLKRTESVVDVDGDERAWYDIPGGGISFQVVNGTIISAVCESLLYQGRDLVGLSEAEVTILFGKAGIKWGEYPVDRCVFVDHLNCTLTFDCRGGSVTVVAVDGGNRKIP